MQPLTNWLAGEFRRDHPNVKTIVDGHPRYRIRCGKLLFYGTCQGLPSYEHVKTLRT